MAVFGLPGGAEWLVLVMVVVMLFVPGAGLVWLGYLLGRRSSSGEQTVSPAPDTTGSEDEDD